MNYSTIEKQLDTDGYVLTMSVGTSMQPMISQRQEQLVIVKVTGAVERDDVVLFKRRNGQYVLHRVINCRDGVYAIRGDNCYCDETVLPDQILGRLDGFYKNGEYISCKENKRYLRYVKFWRRTYPVRRMIYRIRCRLSGMKSRLRGKKNGF